MGMTQTNARYHPSQSEPLCIVSTKTPDLEPKKEAETQACIRIVSDVQFLLLRQNVLLWREGMQRRVGSSSSAGSFLTMEMTELREGGLSQQKSHCTQNYSPTPTENLSGRRRYVCGSNAMHRSLPVRPFCQVALTSIVVLEGIWRQTGTRCLCVSWYVWKSDPLI